MSLFEVRDIFIRTYLIEANTEDEALEIFNEESFDSEFPARMDDVVEVELQS